MERDTWTTKVKKEMKERYSTSQGQETKEKLCLGVKDRGSTVLLKGDIPGHLDPLDHQLQGL